VAPLAEQPEDRRCPECGRGTLATITHDQTPPGSDLDLAQQADSHQVETYTCGHTVTGASLASADADRRDGERRTTEETVETVEPAPDN
jgi:hypothetical protein